MKERGFQPPLDSPRHLNFLRERVVFCFLAGLTFSICFCKENVDDAVHAEGKKCCMHDVP